MLNLEEIVEFIFEWRSIISIQVVNVSFIKMKRVFTLCRTCLYIGEWMDEELSCVSMYIWLLSPSCALVQYLLVYASIRCPFRHEYPRILLVCGSRSFYVKENSVVSYDRMIDEHYDSFELLK